MPHDKHGRLIEKGDVVSAAVFYDRPQEAAKVFHIYEGTDTCNVQLETFNSRDGRPVVTGKETELLLKHDGSKPVAELPPPAEPVES